MELTAKQRLLRAIRGQEVDRTPWSPFLAYWWEQQPEAVTRQGQLNFMESVGADPLLRGFSMPWRVQYHGVDSHRTQTAGEMHEEWTTPVGKLHFGNRLSPNGNTWFLVEHPVKTVEDLKTLQWIYEHSTVEHSPAADEAWAETGERGLYINDLAEGYYVLMNFESKPEFPAELERVMKITEGVMRCLTTVVAE